MKRLGLLLLLASCTDTIDAPPDPALLDVRITYIHAPADWIKERGYALRLAKSAHDQTLAFSKLQRGNRTCVVTLPYPDTVDEALYRRLRTHEERHCHGETHRAKHFQDEEPFD